MTGVVGGGGDVRTGGTVGGSETCTQHFLGIAPDPGCIVHRLSCCHSIHSSFSVVHEAYTMHFEQAQRVKEAREACRGTGCEDGGR